MESRPNGHFAGAPGSGHAGGRSTCRLLLGEPAGVTGGGRESPVMELWESSVPLRSRSYPLGAEWLEADGLGHVVDGTVGDSRSRRDQALLLAAMPPPTERVILVDRIEAWVETAGGCFGLTTPHKAPDIDHPDGHERLAGFAPEPWPCRIFRSVNCTGTMPEAAHHLGCGLTGLVRRNADGRSSAPSRSCRPVRVSRRTSSSTMIAASRPTVASARRRRSPRTVPGGSAIHASRRKAERHVDG